MHNFLFVIFILFSVNLAAFEIIDVDEKTEHINISPKSDIFLDSMAIYNYEDVSEEVFSENFIPLKSKAVSAGYTSDIIWTRFGLHNCGEDSFLGMLEIPVPWVNDLQVYIKSGEDLTLKELGTNHAFSTREISARSFFIPINIDAKEKLTVYMKASGTNIMILSPQLYSQKKSSERLSYISMYNGLLIGMIVIMFIYNLNAYITQKQEYYLYFSYYLVSLLLFMGVYYGYNVQLFWRDSPQFSEAISAPIVALSFSAALLFSRNFLNTSEKFVKSDRLLSLLMYIFLSLAIVTIFMESKLFIVYFTMVLVTLFALLIVYVSYQSVIKKVSGSYFFLAAWIVYIVSLLLSSLMVQGYIEYNSLLYDSFGVGVVLNMIMLSCALIERNKHTIEEGKEDVLKEHNAVDKLTKSQEKLQQMYEKLERKISTQSEHINKKETEFKKFSIRDELTGLYNKTKLEEILENELHRTKRYDCHFSVIVINIDNLKRINSEHGSGVGDTVIKELSDVLAHHIRYLDVIGRWSDTEYLLICPETSQEQAVVASQHLIEIIESHNFFFIKTVTASFGVTMSLQNDTYGDIIDRAYLALKGAKANGKNRVEVA